MKKSRLIAVLLICVISLSGCGTKKISKEIKEKYDGGWYGYLMVTEATGLYESLATYSWDVCGEFTYEETEVDGKKTEIADANFWLLNDYNSPLLQFITIINDDDSWTAGNVYLFNADECNYIRHSFNTVFNDIMVISIRAEKSDGTIAADLYCRKWGQKWDDVAADNPNNLPFSYNSWYTSYIEAGNPLPHESISY